MKGKQNKRSSRISHKKVQIGKGAKKLTAQADLIPHKQDICSLIRNTVDHQCGATALYDVVDAIFRARLICIPPMNVYKTGQIMC